MLTLVHGFRFMLRRLGHAYEVYPLIGLLSIWFVACCGAVLYSFGKVEVWLDRSECFEFGFLRILEIQIPCFGTFCGKI